MITELENGEWINTEHEEKAKAKTSTVQSGSNAAVGGEDDVNVSRTIGRKKKIRVAG